MSRTSLLRHVHSPRMPSLPGRFRDGISIDIPGPYTIEWRSSHAEPRLEEAFPVATGLAFAAAPYVVGAAIVVFAPPWAKPAGVAMLVPSPMDAVYFSIGYTVGDSFQENFM